MMMEQIFDRAVQILTVVALWLFVIWPGRAGKAQLEPFLKRTFAHRGLYRKDQSIPENSLPAFQRAVEAGYGIELDVQLSRDGQVVVYHDDTLNRVSGVDARVDAYSYAELREMPLFASKERMPLFTEVLDTVDGKAPLIVELKYGPDWEALCARTLKLLRAYRGAYCVESFHPRIVRWFWKNAPDVLRGQLAEAYKYARVFQPWYNALMMSRLLTNFLTRPQFIAYRIGPRCVSERLCERLGAMRVRWTARPEDDWKALAETSDSIIFEHMEPETRF